VVAGNFVAMMVSAASLASYFLPWSAVLNTNNCGGRCCCFVVMCGAW
jgi:hypothetical protein